MYRDPKRYGFIFQSYVQLTMLQMHDEISQIQSEQTNKFNSDHGPSDGESSVTTKDRTLILKDLTNKDQTIEVNDKKRKASPTDDCLSNLKKVMKTKLQNEDTNESPLDHVLSDLLHSDADEQSYPINMMERSIFSARYIFVENLFQK